MAAIANLVLNNGAGTPVAKTFVPEVPYRGPNQPAVWVLKEGISPMAHARIEVGLSRNSSNTTRVPFKVIVPLVVLQDNVPTLVSKCIFDSSSGGYIIPQNATTDQINDLEAYVRNLLAHATMKTWIMTGEVAH